MAGMDETPIVELRTAQRQAIRSPQAGAPHPSRDEPVRFDRRELMQILDVYGRMVAAGEWRDYAIDMLREVAVFSVYRRTSEMPLYRIEKRPKLRAKQGAYAVIAANGLVLKRGHDLRQVLRVFDKALRVVGES